MKAVEKGKEKLYFNHYDPADFEHIIDTQHKVIKLMKASNRTKLFCRASCYTRFTQEGGTTAFQQLFRPKFAAIHPIIRVNATSLIVYRPRTNRELEIFLEEVSGLSSKKELLSIYRVATEDEFSFLDVNLSARNVK